ncbi:MAG: rhomboid family intramembrane serine protease [Lewinellaceae bacterium]|nr:rhomboid family intramembrane serine protease [Saprospiraceae bacterium]MCB9331408.1 rhomboid family intramembrane serine protease [Lewinellaceae bacterium]
MSIFQFYQPLTGVVRHLLILNVLMFIGSYALLGNESWNQQTGEVINLGRLVLAVYMPGSEHFQPFQIVTHMFMHGDLGHLAFNMLSLYFFGPMVEMAFGSKRFLFYYLFCGLGAFALHIGVQWWELEQAGYDPRTFNGAMLGASGAIFGIYVAFAYLYPNQIISLLIPPVSLKAKYFVLIMAGIELFYGFRGHSTGIAHFAHIGGALFGFGLLMYWYRFRFR